MRVLVCGGRDFADEALLTKTLDKVLKKYGTDLWIITGGADGADRMAEDWARKNEVPYIGMPARWSLHNKGAGPIRNQAMLDELLPDAVVAFPGGDGTADMVRRAEKLRDTGLDFTVWVIRGD